MVNDKSNLTGSDVALIAGVTNRFVFSFMARPDIKRVSDLKGKRIGVTRVGSSTHTVSLYVLNQAGPKPGDYEILPLGEVPNILIALAAGKIDAGPLSSPTTIRARKAGLLELTTPGERRPGICFRRPRRHPRLHPRQRGNPSPLRSLLRRGGACFQNE